MYEVCGSRAVPARRHVSGLLYVAPVVIQITRSCFNTFWMQLNIQINLFTVTARIFLRVIFVLKICTIINAIH